jgi:hypothetical protein
VNDALLMQPSVDLLDLWEQVAGRPPTNDAVDARIAAYVLATRFPDAPLDVMRNFGLTMHARAAWAGAGFPTFRLSQSLAAALLMTDSDTVPLDQIQFPFDNLVIQFPGPDYLFHTPALDEEEALPVVGVLLQVVKTPKEFSDYDRVNEAVREHAQATVAKFGAETRATRKEIIQGSTDVAREILNSVPTVRGLYMGLLTGPNSPEWQAEHAEKIAGRLGKGRRIGMLPDGRHPLYAPVLSSYMEGRGPATVGELLDDFKTDVSFIGDKEVGAATLSLMHVVGRLVLNFALYVTSSEAPEPNGKPARAAPVRPSRPESAAITPRVWLVGNEIKLAKEVREAAHAAAREGHGRMPWRISARFMVRGHFREQPYGPGRSLRRRQWIAPFWKGEESAVALARQYAVGENEVEPPTRPGGDT